MIDPYKEIERFQFEFIKRQISKLDYKNVSVDEVLKIIEPLKNGLHMIATKPSSGLALFRGVKWNVKPKTIDEISYPPKAFSKINRASQQGEQLFYCCTSKNVALYEMNVEVGNKIALSEWRSTIEDLLFPLIGYTEDNLKRLGCSRKLDFGEFKFSEERFSKRSDQQIEIIEYLSKIFCQPINCDDEEKYKLTIAIAKLFGNSEYMIGQMDDGKFGGLTYPSIKGRGEHDNYAVNISLVDNGSLELYNVEFIEVVEYDPTFHKYKYKIIGYSDSIVGNKIIWKELKNTWTIWDDEEIVFCEDEPIRAFTSDGEEYLPDQI